MSFLPNVSRLLAYSRSQVEEGEHADVSGGFSNPLDLGVASKGGPTDALLKANPSKAIALNRNPAPFWIEV